MHRYNRFKLLAAGVLTALALGQNPAQALPRDLRVAGHDVKLILPDGACAYEAENPVDAEILALLKKGNQAYNDVVLAFADCKDLEKLHQGQKAPATGDYGQILAPLSARDFASYPRAEIVSNMAEYFRKNTGIFEESSDKSKAIIDAVSKGAVKLDSARMLGILHNEADFVQVGLLETVQAQNQTLVLAGVVTTTKLGVPVTINFYHPFTDQASLQALAVRAAAYTRALIALNPDEAAVPATASVPDDNHRKLFVLAIVLLVAAGLAVSVLAFRRKRP